MQQGERKERQPEGDKDPEQTHPVKPAEDSDSLFMMADFMAAASGPEVTEAVSGKAVAGLATMAAAPGAAGGRFVADAALPEAADGNLPAPADARSESAAPPATAVSPGKAVTPEKAAPAGHYQALARRYRPKILGEIVGQDVTVTILRRALKEKRLHHAILFTGIRGVGKTTLARIVARALNCEKQELEPCNQCKICQAVLKDSHLDVIEVDAASNSGVDKVRSLIEVTRYCPSEARNLVFIIDEVHMLSRSAFNAMLKTLEEPPPHVYFLLATTEPHKIPPTVLSRCLRLGLKRVDHPTMVAFLRRVCALEQVTADEDALSQLARSANGSVRDSLSLLDQMILGQEGRITLEAVENTLGGTDRSAGYLVLEACLEGDSSKAIDIAERHFDFGMLPMVLLENLFESVWWLIRYKGAGQTALGDIGSELEMQRVKALAAQVGFSTLSTYWRLLQDAQQRVKEAHFADRALLVALMELTRVKEMPPVSALAESGSRQLDIGTLRALYPGAEIVESEKP